MKRQNGNILAVVAGIAVVALVGVLVFVAMNNSKTAQNTTTSQSTTSSSSSNTLAIKELGKSIDLSGAPYKDITYTMTSVNMDDTSKYVVAIYSKDLNNQLVQEAKKTNSTLDENDTYMKLSANRAVYAYYYTPATSGSTEPEMVDGIAATIIDPQAKTEASKFYVGFMGPGSSSDSKLNDKNVAFRDWIEANLK